MFEKGNEIWKKAYPMKEKTKKKLRISAQIRWAKVKTARREVNNDQNEQFLAEGPNMVEEGDK